MKLACKGLTVHNIETDPKALRTHIILFSFIKFIIITPS